MGLLGLLLLFLIFLLSSLIFLLRKRQKLPPGPPQLPLIGCLPFLDLRKGMVDFVLDPRVTNHPLATVSVLGKNFFFINDLDLAKELFEKEEFSGKNPPTFIRKHRFPNDVPRGIVATQGHHWTTQRRFSLKSLKDLGFGRKSIEDSIHFEVEEMIEHCFSSEEDVLLGSDFNIPIINILWQIVANKRMSLDSREDMELMKLVTDFFTAPHIDMPLPKLAYACLPKSLARLFSVGKRNYGIEDMAHHFSLEVQRRRGFHDPENPADFIDVYLTELEKGKELNVLDLVACIQDFFMAGTETSSTTLKWTLLYLTLHQDVQDRCRKEIQTVLGKTKVTSADMHSLPYVQATIAEVQRMSCVAPVSLPHYTTKPTRVGEFVFPEKSVFLTNISAIMKDPRFVPNPNVFDPDRFLTEEGRFVKTERLMPFGIGRRYCMGEGLARNEVFIFTVDLLQNISFLPPAKNPQPDTNNYLCNFTRIPDDFYLRVCKI